jgi:imidazolonepropionase-like amidohydrolase
VSLSVTASRIWIGPGRVLDDGEVLCDGGSIVSVGPRAGVSADRELRIDGFVMPAFADRHVHIGLADAATVLRRGVTAVRDLGWPPERIFPLADLADGPSFDGPLIRAAGPILTAPGGYPSRAPWAPEGTALEVAGPGDAAAAVSTLAARGAAAVKVALHADAGPTPTDADLAAICDAARSHGLPVTVHAQGVGQIERALGAGVQELAHTPWVPLSDRLVALCAQQVRIVSTLDIHGFGTRTPALEAALDNLRRFHRAGGEVAYGTDLGNGAIPPGIHTRELALLREAGLDADDVLQAATRAPLEAGAPADLIGLDSDPREDFRAFDDLLLVVRSGRPVLLDV